MNRKEIFDPKIGEWRTIEVDGTKNAASIADSQVQEPNPIKHKKVYTGQYL